MDSHTCGKKNKPFTVLVEGNIGSGKTTYLQYFTQYKDVTLLTEPVEQWRNLDGWNLLDLMYKDPSKWAMPFQSFVALTMLSLHNKEVPTRVKLMERSFFSARYCFVENMLRSETMHPAMGSVLDEWFKHMMATVDISADLIVYLRATPSIVHERIRKRARSEEECIPLSYLEQLHKLHEDWLVHGTTFKRPAPVLILNADLDLNRISDEYRKSEHRVLSTVMDVVINSPSKKSPKRTGSRNITPMKAARMDFGF